MRKTDKIFEELFFRYPSLKPIKEQIRQAYDCMKQCYCSGGKLLIAGNGGSAADANHMVGELMKGFVCQRKISPSMENLLKNVNDEKGSVLAEKLQETLPAISLTEHSALSTAYLNDVEPVLGFAQQLYGYGTAGDVLVAISTSGNSENIIYASIVARAKGMKVIALTGKDGGELKSFSDISIIVPENETYKIQELHLPVYHTLCLMLEEEFYGK